MERLSAIISLAAVIGGALWVVFAKTGLGKYLEELFAAVGREHGSRVVERGRRRRAGETARYRASLAALRAAGRQSAQLPVPVAHSSPTASLLGLGLVSVTGPFVGQSPVVLIVGADAAPAAQLMLDALSTWSGGIDVLVIQEGGSSVIRGGTRRYIGTYLEQLTAALDDADALVTGGEADFVAVILRLPATGTYTSDSALIRRLLSTIFNGRRNALVTWMSPVEGAQPDSMVFLSSTIGRDLLVSFQEIGADRWEFHGQSAYVPMNTALRAVLYLLGDPNGFLISEGDISPSYDAEAQLILGPAALNEMRARVDTVDNERALATIDDLHIGTLVNGEARDLLVSQLLVQNVAYLFVGSGEARQLPHVVPAEVDTLVVALRARDAQEAALSLSSAGRSWLESAEPQHYLHSIQEARAAFPYGTRAWAWSHYLLALDGMLRLGRAEVDHFSDRDISAAERLGLGVLFRAEDVEFARIRGDMDYACIKASKLMPSLVDATPTGESDVDYALGTASFLIGNLMRRGGRYETAEKWVRLALGILDRRQGATPAMATEALHCQYALNVCAAMQGRPLLVDPAIRGPASDVFARGLVTLSNGSTSWILGDLEGSRRYAAEAAAYFDRIGYSRYAQRAHQVENHINLWEELRKGKPDILAEQEWRIIRSAIRGVEDEPLNLSELRPSRALGVLSFGLTYGNPSLRRSISLPRVLGDDVLMGPEWVANSLADADALLRKQMYIDASVTVPLIVD